MTAPRWWNDHADLIEFAQFLFAPVEHADPVEILYFFEKPWKWTPEHTEWKVTYP